MTAEAPRDDDCSFHRAVRMSAAFDLPHGECNHRAGDVPHIPVYKVRDFKPFTFGPEETP